MSNTHTSVQPERWQIIVRDMSPGEIESKRTKSEIWFLIAAFTAFFASSFFVVKYMVGGDFSPTTWTGEQWGNALLGLLITAVITAFQYYLYSIDQRTAAAILGAVIAVFFGMFSEISQSMEREDATVRHRSESSPVFQAALGKLQTLGSSNGSEAYVTLIAVAQASKAEAETVLVQCETRYKGNYSRDKCKREQQQTIAAEQAKIASYRNAGNIARADKTQADKDFISKLQAMQYDENQHYAMIRLIRNLFNVAGIWASFLFSFSIIGTFEYAFHFIGGYLNDLKKALRALGYETGVFKKQPARSSVADPSPGIEAPTVPVQLEQSSTTVPVQPELSDAAKQIEMELYPVWLEQVATKAIAPGARDTKRFLSQSTYTKGDKTGLTIQEMQRIWTSWQDRAAGDGVLKYNPKYQPGNRQPKYII